MLGLAVITFPALIPAEGAVTAIQWLLTIAAVALFVAAAVAGIADEART